MVKGKLKINGKTIRYKFKIQERDDMFEHNYSYIADYKSSMFQIFSDTAYIDTHIIDSAYYDLNGKGYPNKFSTLEEFLEYYKNIDKNILTNKLENIIIKRFHRKDEEYNASNRIEKMVKDINKR